MKAFSGRRYTFLVKGRELMVVMPNDPEVEKEEDKEATYLTMAEMAARGKTDDPFTLIEVRTYDAVDM